MSGQFDSASSSSSPTVPFTAAEAVAHIANLEAQLATATQQLASANSEGRRYVALYDAEKAKSVTQQQSISAATAAAVNRVKVPAVPQFKGEIGYSVDGWLRRLVKHFDFYGAVSFPNDESKIKFAVMFLEGAAMDWWDGLTAADKSRIITWELFIETLYSRFRPIQAATVARMRLGSLKQTGGVSAYINLFQRELTPIRDMSVADQMHYFRQGLKPLIAQRVLEKLPKTLHEAMDMAILADAHFSKSGAHAPQYFQYNRGGGSSSRAAPTSSSSDMDLTNINNVSGEEEVKFHMEEDSPSPPNDMMREFNRMKGELKKYQAQAAISALGSAAAASSSSVAKSRVPVSKEEFDHCWKNRLCLNCKKPNHRASECRGTYKPLN